MKRLLAAILCFCMASAQMNVVVMAQTGSEWSQYEWTLEDSPRTKVQASSIVQDSKGTIYISTTNPSEAIWKDENGKWIDLGLKALKGASTTSGIHLYVGHDDTLYALSEGIGIWSYDGHTWTEMNGSSGDITFMRMAQDKNGDLYAISRAAVYKYDGSEWILTDGPKNPMRIVASSKGNIYVGGYTGTWKLNDTTWESMGSPLLDGEPQTVGTILETREGTLYAATMGSGIYNGGSIWEYRSGKWVNISPSIDDSIFGVSFFTYERSGVITCMLEDKNGAIYAGTIGGVWRYNGGESWTCITTDLPALSNYARSLINGADGNIYMCAGGAASNGGGIWCYDGKNWTNIDANLTGYAITISALTEGLDGTVYVGGSVSGGGVLKKTQTGWEDISGDITSLSNLVPVNVLLTDKNGDILAGTDGGGLWRYRQGTWANIGGDMTDEVVSRIRVQAMASTEVGTVYIGANGSGTDAVVGLWRYDGEKTVRIPDFEMRVRNMMVADGILYLACESRNLEDGKGTYEGAGMWTYDGVKFTNITPSLSGDALKMNGMIKASDGTIYTVAEDDNLWVYDGVKWKSTAVTWPGAAFGLNGAINGWSSIIEDKSGDIYITLNNGFCKYDGNVITPVQIDTVASRKSVNVMEILETKSGTQYFSLNGSGILIGTPKKIDAPSGGRFSDVTPGVWYYDDVEYVAKKGLLSGTGANHFSPDMTLNRAMIVTVLGRLAGVDTKKYAGASFADVNTAQYYAPYVKWWAHEIAISEGISDKQFFPEEAITRQEFTVMLNKYSEYMGYTLPKLNMRANFADEGKIDSYALGDVYMMQQAGVINGRANNILDPMSSITRAEFSAMLHRFISLTTDLSEPQG